MLSASLPSSFFGYSYVTFRKPLPRFVSVVPKEPASRVPFLSTHRAADAAVPKLRKIIDSVLEKIRESLTVSEILDILRNGEKGRLEAAIKPTEDIFEDIQNLFLGIIERSGQAAAEELPNILEAAKSIRKQEIAFDITNPRATRWAQFQSGKLITGPITQETIKAVRGIISDAFRKGWPPEEAGMRIRSVIGLTERQARAVNAAYTRNLATGMAEDRAKKLMEKMAEKKLRERSLLIARTETLAASNFGQSELWRQARDEGLVPEGAKRRWIVTGDDRLCERCKPLKGVETGLDGMFPGGVSGPPLHPACRCALGLSTAGLEVEAPPPVSPEFAHLQEMYPGMSDELIRGMENVRPTARELVKKLSPDFERGDVRAALKALLNIEGLPEGWAQAFWDTEMEGWFASSSSPGGQKFARTVAKYYGRDPELQYLPSGFVRESAFFTEREQQVLVRMKVLSEEIFDRFYPSGSLYRGVRGDLAEEVRRQLIQSGSARVGLNAVSSWSADPTMAQIFGRGGAMLSKEVAKSDVWTTFGGYASEVVVGQVEEVSVFGKTSIKILRDTQRKPIPLDGDKEHADWLHGKKKPKGKK